MLIKQRTTKSQTPTQVRPMHHMFKKKQVKKTSLKTRADVSPTISYSHVLWNKCCLGNIRQILGKHPPVARPLDQRTSRPSGNKSLWGALGIKQKLLVLSSLKFSNNRDRYRNISLSFTLLNPSRPVHFRKLY